MDGLTWYLMVWAAVTVPGVLFGWRWVFPKAGRPAWAALIPFYNIYVLVVGVARLSLFWFILLLLPVVQIIAAILVNVEVHGKLTAIFRCAVGISHAVKTAVGDSVGSPTAHAADVKLPVFRIEPPTMSAGEKFAGEWNDAPLRLASDLVAQNEKMTAGAI